jgi:hypothetical protein
VAVTSAEGLVVVLENQGGALAVAQTWLGSGPQHGVSAVDTTGDGAPELVLASRSGPGQSDDWCVSVLENAGSGSFALGPQLCFPFQAQQGEILAATAADVDDDGFADLVFGLSPDIAVALNDGNGGFLPHTLHAASSDSRQLVPAHLDGDSFPDLATVDGSAEGRLAILRNRGTDMGAWLGFEAPVVLPVDGPVLGVAALDIDGDLDLDLACSEHGAAEIAIFRNSIFGGFLAGERLPTPAGPVRLHAADVTGDGVADLLGGRRAARPGAVEVMAYLYPVHSEDKISVLFDSAGLPLRESSGKAHVAAGSQLAASDRGVVVDTLQAMFDDALGLNAVIVDEGSAGCIHAVVSSGKSPSGALYGNAGAAGLPVVIYEGEFRANPAYLNDTEIAQAMAETVAHEIGPKLGLQGHNMHTPQDLLTAGELVHPDVRKQGLRRFDPVDKTRLTLNQPLVTAEPKSGANYNDLAIFNGSFCVPPMHIPDDSYVSMMSTLSAPIFLEFGYLNEVGEFVYQGDTNNQMVPMGSHFDGGFDLAVRSGGAVHSLSNGGGCFTLSAPNPANPTVYLRADVEFAAVSATLSLDVDASNSTGGLLIPSAGGCGSAGFCTAKAGLVCGIPTITANGTPSASSTSGFTISAGPALSCKAGILLYSNQAIVPGAPFEGGALCLEAMGLRRAGSTNSMGTPGPASCDGEFSVDMNTFSMGVWVVPRCDGTPAGIPANNPAAFLSNPGITISVQYWGRDSQATGSFVSAGLQYVVGP